jgi:hypothetical protein
MMAVPKGFTRFDGMDGHVYLKPAKVAGFSDWTPYKGENRARIILETNGGSFEMIVVGTADEVAEVLAKGAAK